MFPVKTDDDPKDKLTVIIGKEDKQLQVTHDTQTSNASKLSPPETSSTSKVGIVDENPDRCSIYERTRDDLRDIDKTLVTPLAHSPL